jgi:hypothetical protein
MALQPFDLGHPFSFLILYTVGRTHWTLPTHRTTQAQNKRTQTSMPRVGFEPTTSAFEQTKTIYALDCPATVIGLILVRYSENIKKNINILHR